MSDETTDTLPKTIEDAIELRDVLRSETGLAWEMTGYSSRDRAFYEAGILAGGLFLAGSRPRDGKRQWRAGLSFDGAMASARREDIETDVEAGTALEACAKLKVRLNALRQSLLETVASLEHIPGVD